MLLIGSHVSFKKDDQLVGSVKEALSYGSTTFMFYTGAPQNTARTPIDDMLTLEAMKLMKDSDIDYSKVVVHAPYIINLANNKDISKFEFSVNFLINEIERCDQLGVKYLVLHPGSHVGLGEREAIKNVITGLNMIFDSIKTDVVILLETMAGKGTEIGINFHQINKIITGVKSKKNIGVCMDTCHMHDAGYELSDFDKLLDDFDEIVGLNYLHCIHINDSKNEKGAHKDRQENLGKGYIGLDNLIKIIYNDRIKDIPKILETPYIDGKAPYKEEIDLIKSKAS